MDNQEILNLLFNKEIRSSIFKKLKYELYAGDSNKSMVDEAGINIKNTLLKYKKSIKPDRVDIKNNTIELNYKVCKNDFKKGCKYFDECVIKISLGNAIIYRYFKHNPESIDKNEITKISYLIEF